VRSLISSASTSLIPIYGPGAVNALGTVSFGRQVPGAVFVPMRQLGGPVLEVWPAGGENEILFGSIAFEDAGAIESVTREAYAKLIADVRAAGYPYFLRMWNHVGGINDLDPDGERYQLFCAGRHDAFVEAGYHHNVDLPAASAVGMPGRGLVIYFLAAREPGVQVENPRQVSAYDYPPQYGAKSPSFSRLTVWRETVFVSGTSSVLGHETVHQGDVMAQLEETLRNIEVVLNRTGKSMGDVAAAKTYLRHASDYERVARRLEGVFAANLYLEADICRSNLLIEIEAVARY